MMKLFFMFLFMIPQFFLFNWYIMFLSLIIVLYFLINFYVFNVYFSFLSYFMGFDLMSLVFFVLSLWIILLIILSSKNSTYMSEFMFLVLSLMIFLFLSFSVNNLFMFYLFFECTLIPTVFLIFGWGYQPERLISGYYMLFYTLFFSLPMFLGIFYIYSDGNSLFYFLIFVDMNVYLYLSLFMAFLVKLPLVFLHFWLPKAHVEAPVSGSMILAGVLLKLGGYGIIRLYNFSYFMDLNCFFICLSLYGMFMIGFLCIFQVDLKTLIAYSSVSHMAMVIGGLMSMNLIGSVGSLCMMVGHGLCSSGMFCLANIVYERTGSRLIFLNSGMLMLMPSMSMFWFLFMVNNMSSPLSLNFLGEILLIGSLISWDYYSMLFLMFSSFLSCMYSIYLYSFVNHGNIFGGMNFFYNNYYIEYMLMFMHFLPLNFLFLKFDIFSIFI